MVRDRRAAHGEIEPILAAGGIVDDLPREKIAVVHRRRYPGEIGLPKGKVKLEQRETVVHAAEREVREEIGYGVRALDFAGLTHYRAKGRPKVVFYYRMEIVGEAGGIDEEEIRSVAWITAEEAAATLTHAEDRDLIATVFALDPRKFA